MAILYTSSHYGDQSLYFRKVHVGFMVEKLVLL